MSVIQPERGHVYRIHDDEYGRMHCLVISTVPSHDADTSCLALRVAVTNRRFHFPYWVKLGSGDPGFGYVVVHDLDRVGHDEMKEDLGPLSLETMMSVKQSLKRLFDL